MMFNKLSLLAFLAPLVSAITISVPENPTSSGQITINWTTQTGDPETFSFELLNVAFNNAFAIANNVDSSLHSLTLTLPVVPVGAGYTIEAVNIGNINDVFASTPTFSIGEATTTSSASSTGTVRTTSSNSTATRSGTTATGPSTALTTNTNTNTGTTSTSTTPRAAASDTNVPQAFSGAGKTYIPAAGLAVAALSAVLGSVALAF